MNKATACKILNVGMYYSQEEVKNNYRVLAKIHHPDHGGSVEKMQDINAAYVYLCDSVSNDDAPVVNTKANNVSVFDFTFCFSLYIFSLWNNYSRMWEQHHESI